MIPLIRSYKPPHPDFSGLRLLLIAAHPDDETIGAGIFMTWLKDVRVVHVTDGSPLDLSDAHAAGFSTRDDYAAARRRETARVLAKIGLRKSKIKRLHFVDQHVSFCLAALTRRVLLLLNRYRPHLLLTHPYEGGHPDHDSVAFACQTAHQIYGHEHSDARPLLLEFACYHAKNGHMCTYDLLPFRNETEYRIGLNHSEQQIKTDMLRAFESQARTLQPFFPPTVELFRTAPHYDFSCPPHDGKLFYENFDWGIDGPGWRSLALKAQDDLLYSEDHCVSHDS